MDNSPFISLLQSLNLNSFWLGIKVVFLIAFAVYIGFAVVVISQVRQMTNTISGGFEKQLILLSWIHLGVSLFAFLWALVIL